MYGISPKPRTSRRNDGGYTQAYMPSSSGQIPCWSWVMSTRSYASTAGRSSAIRAANQNAAKSLPTGMPRGSNKPLYVGSHTSPTDAWTAIAARHLGAVDELVHPARHVVVAQRQRSRERHADRLAGGNRAQMDRAAGRRGVPD